MIQNIALLATWSFPCFHVDHRRVLRGDGLSNRRYVPVTCARVNCANKTNPSIATSLARWSAPLVVRTRQQVCLLICFPTFRIKPNHDPNLRTSTPDYVAETGQTAIRPLLQSGQTILCSLYRIASVVLLRPNQTMYMLRCQTKPRGSLHTKEIRCRVRLPDASSRIHS